MNSYLVELNRFFSQRLQGIIAFKEDIDEVSIYVTRNETYGNDYYYIHFDIINKKTTPQNIYDVLTNVFYKDNLFYLKAFESAHFLIKKRGNRKGYDEEGLRLLKDFYDSYSIITKFLAEFLVSIIPTSSLKINTLNGLPEFNYLLRYWSDKNFSFKNYQKKYNRKFTDDCDMYFSILEHSRKYKSSITNKTILVSDVELCNNSTLININILRKKIIEYFVPFKIIGNKTADKIMFDILALRHFIYEKVKSDDKFNDSLLLLAINEYIDSFKIVKDKKNLFIENYPIQINDFLLLKNERLKVKPIVQVTDVNFDNYQTFIIIKYINVTNDLKTGKKTGSCHLSYIEKVVSFSTYLSKTPKIGWLYRSQLLSLFSKQKKLMLKNEVLTIKP